MKITIIDSRNHHLNALLDELGEKGVIVSLILPDITQELPSDIKLALHTYRAASNRGESIVNIIVEVNEWVRKEQASKLLQHSSKLVKQFFSDNLDNLSQCNLSILDNSQLLVVKPDSEVA